MTPETAATLARLGEIELRLDAVKDDLDTIHEGDMPALVAALRDLQADGPKQIEAAFMEGMQGIRWERSTARANAARWEGK